MHLPKAPYKNYIFFIKVSTIGKISTFALERKSLNGSITLKINRLYYNYFGF